jgi:hypothetical protein
MTNLLILLSIFNLDFLKSILISHLFIQYINILHDSAGIQTIGTVIDEEFIRFPRILLVSDDKISFTDSTIYS